MQETVRIDLLGWETIPPWRTAVYRIRAVRFCISAIVDLLGARVASSLLQGAREQPPQREHVAGLQFCSISARWMDHLRQTSEKEPLRLSSEEAALLTDWKARIFLTRPSDHLPSIVFLSMPTVRSLAWADARDSAVMMPHLVEDSRQAVDTSYQQYP